VGRERTCNRIDARVLLMSGRRSPLNCRLRCAVAGIIVHSTVIELPDANHHSATNGKRPQDVARELRSFFSQQACRLPQ